MRIVRGMGVIEDRIKANIARRKAVAEKRDEAQSFLANVGKKAKVMPSKEYMDKNEYYYRQYKLLLDALQETEDTYSKEDTKNVKEVIDEFYDAIKKHGSLFRLKPHSKEYLEDKYGFPSLSVDDKPLGIFYDKNRDEYHVFDWYTNKKLKKYTKKVLKEYNAEKKRLNL